MHGVLDYTTAAALLAAPAVLGLRGTPAGAVLRAAGAGHVGYSLLTAYELGVVKVLPYRAHLAIDAGAAMGLSVAPLVVGRRRRARWPFKAAPRPRAQWLPHAAFGVWELAAVALSAPSATDEPDAASSSAAGAPVTDPTQTVMPDGADVALADRGAAARRETGGGGIGSGAGPGSDPEIGGLQS